MSSIVRFWKLTGMTLRNLGSSRRRVMGLFVTNEQLPYDASTDKRSFDQLLVCERDIVFHAGLAGASAIHQEIRLSRASVL